MRYTGWRRLTGNTAERPDLLDFGKKLLGYLDQQRKLSGVKTCSIERTLPDGSVVRARFEYDIPVIEVRAAGGQGSAEAADTSGFVLSPSPTAAHGTGSAVWPDIGDFPEVLVAHGAHGYSHYKDTFTQGLRQCGNIDWRNSDESVIVSFYGPRTRYFDITNAVFRPWVLRNGYTMLDVESAAFTALDATAGMTDALVVGAAVRGKQLLFIARNGLFGDTEMLFSADLDGNPRTQAAVGVVYTSITKLAERPMLDSEISSATHPWHFNQSGTQARCIRGYYDGTNDVYAELTWDCADLEAIALTREDLGAGITTTTTTQTSARAESVTRETTWTGFIDTSIQTVTLDPGPPATTNYPGQTHTITKPTAFGVNGSIGGGTVNTTTQSDPAQFKFAVDFRRDVPVYGYLTPASDTHAASFGASTFSYAQGYNTLVSSRSGSGSETRSQPGIGIATDFASVTPVSTFQSQSTYSGGIDLNHINQFATDWGGTMERQETATSASTTQSLALLYLDLRAKWLVYEIKETRSYSTTAIAYSEPIDLSAGMTDIPVSASITSRITARTVVRKGDKALADNTLTLSETVTSTNTTLPPIVTTSFNVSGGVVESTTNNPYYFLPSDASSFIYVPDFNTYTGIGDVTGVTASVASDASSQPLPLTTLMPRATAQTDNDHFRHAKRTDRNGFIRYGSWQHYKAKYAFSMGLIVENDASQSDTSIAKTLPDRWLSGANIGNLNTLSLKASERWNSGVQAGLVGPPIDLYFPIFVVPKTDVR